MASIEIPIAMVEQFQCPGCVCGGDTKCGKFKWDAEWQRCVSHVLGTMFGLGNWVALGMPKGFNKPGFDFAQEPAVVYSKMLIRLWPGPEVPNWNHLNIPVWALMQDGFLFVRTYCPRINVGYVDVIQGGALELVPNAIDVSKFIGEID
ncbi:MAG: hypothetical protein U0930_03715 [Pirellulales bacterium]